MRISKFLFTWIAIVVVALYPVTSSAWYDETHLAIAKVASYYKWFNAAAPDVAKLKMGNKEGHNHFVNNPRDTVVTPEMVMAQVERYNQKDPAGHLYGAIIASVRDYISFKKKGQYAEYHLAYCVHKMDGAVNDEIFDNLDKIKIYPIEANNEEGLAKEIVRIANLSLPLGYKLEDKNRLLTADEAYQQLSHSASLMKAVLRYVRHNND